MANRTGIELLPGSCRVVEVQPSTGWFGRNRAKAGASRVKAFYEIPYSPDSPGSCASELRRVLGSRSREIRVAIWGLRSTYQTLYLPQADRADLEVMARREARSKTSGVQAAASAASASTANTDGIMVGEHREGGRVEVGYVFVTPGEVQSRIQPFLNAGLAIAGVVTPAVAHAGLVRQRWGQFADAATAVLSVNARATAMTVARGGVVLFSRELPWGHETDRADRGYVFDAAAFAGQLASELRRSLVFVKQQSKVDVSHVLVCGDLPDLRALTGPLMHELNVEVETLDSLEGFDVAHLPEPADEFRTKIGALRTAWALAAETAPAVNVMPRDAKARSIRIDRQTQTRLGWAVAAGLLIAVPGWAGSEFLARSSRTTLAEMRRNVAVLEPESQRQAEALRVAGIVAARTVALQAFATQGPRLARVIGAFAKNATGDVAFTSVTVAPGVAAWRIKIEGQVEGENPQAAQSRFNTFMNGLRASSLLGDPIVPPTIRIKTQELKVEEAVAEAESKRAVLEPIQVETPHSSDQGPAYLDVARDGKLYRIPLRRYAEQLNRLTDETRWTLRSGYPAAGSATALPPRSAASARTSWSVMPVRVAANVLDFTIEYEVRK